MGQILSQSEIEAILSGLDLSVSSASSTPVRESAVPADLPLYDFEHPEPLNRSQLDGLRFAAAATSQRLQATLARLFRSATTVSLLGVEQSTFHDYLATAESPCCVAIFESAAEFSLLEMNRTLAFAMIDCLLGGDPTTAASIVDRPFTEVEQHLLQRAVTAILPDFIAGFGLPESLTLSGLISDGTTFPKGQSHEAVALVSFETGLGATTGLMQLCIPWKQAVPHSDRSAIHRRNGSQTLKSGAAKMPVIASACLAKLKLSAKDFSQLSPGDVLVTDVNADEEIRMEVDGREIFRGRPGQSQNRKVMLLTKPVHRDDSNR